MRSTTLLAATALMLGAAAFLTTLDSAVGPGSGTASAQDAQAPAEAAGTVPASADEAGDAPIFLMPEAGPFSPSEIAVPNAAAIRDWARSGHADASARAFRHWDEDGEIPPNCATCHAGEGFRAFHGLDGSTAGEIAEPIPVGGVVDCETCHSPGMSRVEEIALPNGMMHPVSTGEASCVTCHQGRASGERIASATGGLPADDPHAELRFVNPHYNIAAATALGGYAGLGYEYPGKSYTGRFDHARPVQTCVQCHEPHRLEVDARTCLTCHETGDAKAIRIQRQSHDGSGDTAKGIHADIAANHATLFALVEEYAAAVAGTPLAYDGARYPYFFADANGDGRADEADGEPVPYGAFTPRMLQAVYNWKFVGADPGAHVHNPHYALELLYDSIEDLSLAMGRDVASLEIAR
jgi:hypothetical protein